jgi:hypothetical protein
LAFAQTEKTAPGVFRCRLRRRGSALRYFFVDFARSVFGVSFDSISLALIVYWMVTLEFAFLGCENIDGSDAGRA